MASRSFFAISFIAFIYQALHPTKLVSIKTSPAMPVDANYAYMLPAAVKAFAVPRR